jgi:hypothetical protein
MDVIRAVEGGAVTLAELSRLTGVDTRALAPMVDLLAARGLIGRDTLDGRCAPACAAGCSPKGCPLVGPLPAEVRRNADSHRSSLRRDDWDRDAPGDRMVSR